MEIPVLIAYSNHGYVDFAVNLILNVESTVKNHKLHFYCLDKQIYDLLSNYSYPFLTLELFEQNINSGFQEYGTRSYNALTHTKTSVLKHALNKYPFIHFIDCDVVCVKEPDADYYAKYRDYDIVFQCDSTSDKPMFSPWQCTGNMSLRRTVRTMDLIERIDICQKRYPLKNDQNCLEQVLATNRVYDIRAFRKTKLYTYPRNEYCNGSWKGDTADMYFFHANHVLGKEPKIELLKKLNKWYT